MAKSKSSTETNATRLTHRNGATVTVDPDKAERLVAGGMFSAETKRSTSKSS